MINRPNKIISSFFVVAAVFIAYNIGVSQNSADRSTSDSTSVEIIKKETSAISALETDEISLQKTDTEETESSVYIDFSNVQTEYVLSNGNFASGIDIPCGKFDIYAVSGNGNLSTYVSSRLDVNEIFGVNTSGNNYTESYKNVKFPEESVLHLSGGLSVKLVYKEITRSAKGREETQESIVLTSGNYTAGEDFPAGTYTISVVDGSGNVYGGNILRFGINEIMGSDATNDMYIQKYHNAVFVNSDVLKVSGGVSIKITPMEIKN